jgi:hypothetical protein
MRVNFVILSLVVFFLVNKCDSREFLSDWFCLDLGWILSWWRRLELGKWLDFLVNFNWRKKYAK